VSRTTARLAAAAPKRHRVFAVPRRRQCHGHSHDHHQGEHIPVADRAVEPREGVRMSHQRSAPPYQEGVHSHGRRNGEIAVADHAQMDTAGRDHDAATAASTYKAA